MRRTKKTLLAILTVVILIQFIRPARNSNRSDVVNHTDFITRFDVPSNIAAILKTSCYDCHSNDTRYPWYADIEPFGWLLAKHIRDGKKDLNFSEFTLYSKRRQLSKLKSIRNSIKDGSMPLSSYTLLHTDAKLSDDQKSLLQIWTTKTIDSLSNTRE
jgi:hypothetical protein